AAGLLAVDVDPVAELVDRAPGFDRDVVGHVVAGAEGRGTVAIELGAAVAELRVAGRLAERIAAHHREALGPVGSGLGGIRVRGVLCERGGGGDGQKGQGQVTDADHGDVSSFQFWWGNRPVDWQAHTPYRPANEHRLPPGSETTELSSAAVITRVACFRTGRLNPCWIARGKCRIDDPFRSVAARHSWRLPLAAATIRLSRMAE